MSDLRGVHRQALVRWGRRGRIARPAHDPRRRAGSRACAARPARNPRPRRVDCPLPPARPEGPDHDSPNAPVPRRLEPRRRERGVARENRELSQAVNREAGPRPKPGTRRAVGAPNGGASCDYSVASAASSALSSTPVSTRWNSTRRFCASSSFVLASGTIGRVGPKPSAISRSVATLPLPTR